MIIPTKPFALSVKAILRDQEERCLLVRRSAGQKWSPGKWEFPGGKTETGETFDRSILREVAEETGLTITLLRIAGALEFEMPDVKVACLLVEACLVSGEVRLSQEHDDYAWVTVSELSNMDLAEPYARFSQKYGIGGNCSG